MTDQPIIAIATITPLPEHREAVRQALETASVDGHAEEGCLLYALHETPDGFVMIEKWSSPDAAKAHGAGPVFAAVTGGALRTLGVSRDMPVQVAQSADPKAPVAKEKL